MGVWCLLWRDFKWYCQKPVKGCGEKISSLYSDLDILLTKRYKNWRSWNRRFHVLHLIYAKYVVFTLGQGRVVLNKTSMDHRIFWFATRGQCIKGKKARLFWTQPRILFQIARCIVVLLCTISGGKSKDAVVHWSVYCRSFAFLKLISFFLQVLRSHFQKFET